MNTPTPRPTLLPSDNPRVPQAEHPFRHCTDIQTRFTDIDTLGHVNNNAYLSFMDLAKLRYFSDISGGAMGVENISAVIVNINCDFYEPSYFNEPLQVWTAVTHIGHRSFTIEQRVVSADGHRVKCIGRTILAGFDPATAQGADLDPEMTRNVREFEQMK